MPISEAQKRAQERYDSKNTVQYHLKLNLKTDADIIAWLDDMAGRPGGKQGYIKELIRRDIEGDR